MLKEIKIELTNRCSRNCIHCSSSATSNLASAKELDIDDVSKILIEAKEMREHPENYKKFSSVKELMEDLDK